jgi:hypothetical protein
MRLTASISCRPARRTATLFAGLVLAGCAGASQNSGPTPSLLDKLLATTTPAQEEDVASIEKAPPPAAKNSCGSPAQCKSALKKMVDNPKRGWVGQHQHPAAYTDGTRLFAYRALRAKLSCRELSAALTEVHGASKSLAGEVPGVSKEQLTRTRALNSQVENELAKERGARCKG